MRMLIKNVVRPLLIGRLGRIRHFLDLPTIDKFCDVTRAVKRTREYFHNKALVTRRRGAHLIDLTKGVETIKTKGGDELRHFATRRN